MNNNELMHYGVKGMKWGHRKAQQYSDRAKKAREKGDDSLADRFEKKSQYMTRRAAYNKKQADVNETRSIGSKLAMNLLAGPFANRTYNSIRASGGSRVIAAGATLAVGILGPMGLGHVLVSKLIARGEASSHDVKS